MQSLMELSDEYNRLLELAGSLNEDDQEAFLDTLDGLTYELSLKVDSYVSVITSIKANQAMIEEEIERLNKVACTLDANVSRMKQRLSEALDIMNETELKGKFHKIKKVRNGGKAPLIITGEVPDSYKKIIMENDNEKIRKAIDEGKQVDFAFLGERGTHIKID